MPTATREPRTEAGQSLADGELDGLTSLIVEIEDAAVRTTDLYIAIVDTKYAIYGLGESPEEARRACYNEYRRTDDSGYGATLRTYAGFVEYFSPNVWGPVRSGKAVTEG